MMWRKVKDIDFDDMIERVRRATNVANRRACDPIIQSDLAFVTNRAAALRTLRNDLAIAALDATQTIADIDPGDPLVQALVRCQHHRDAQLLPVLQVQRLVAGPDASPRLTEIAAMYAQLEWNADAIEQLLVTAIKTRAGEVCVDDETDPWRISWEPAGAAAYALMMLVTLRTLGDL